MNEKKRLIYIIWNVIALFAVITAAFLLFTTYGTSLKGVFQKHSYTESAELREEIVSQMQQVMDHIVVAQYVWDYESADNALPVMRKQISKKKVLELVSETGEVKWLTVEDMIAIGRGTNGIRLLKNAGLIDQDLNCYVNYVSWIYGPIYVQKKIPVLSVILLLNEMYRTYVESELELENLEQEPSNLMYYVRYRNNIYTNSADYWNQKKAEGWNSAEDVQNLSKGEMQYCYVSDQEYYVDASMETVYHSVQDYMRRPAFSKLSFIENFLVREGILKEEESIRSYVYGQLDGGIVDFWRGAAVGISFDTSLEKQDNYVLLNRRYEICKNWALFLCAGGAVSGVMWIVTLSRILFDNRKTAKQMAAKKGASPGGQAELSEIDAAYPEIIWGGAAALSAASFLLLQIPAEAIRRHCYSLVDVGSIFGYYKMEGFWLYFLYAIWAGVWYLVALRLIRRFQIRKWMGIRFADTSICGHLIRFFYAAYQNKSVTAQTAAEYILFGAAILLNTVFFFQRGSLRMVLFWINSAVLLTAFLYVLLSRAIWQKRISETIQRMTQGDVGIKVETKEMRGSLLRLAEDVNYLGSGLEKALEEATSNERMKTELLTNVSHDIKTPLTSIVNYVDLLKMTDIPDEKAREYLDILEEKSIRLKRLTEDLVEAARANSGTLALEMAPLDLGQFLQQVVGETEYKFAERNLQLIASIPDEGLFIQADGNHLWRVFENLMNNAYKYSLPATRVYVDCGRRQSRAEVVIKNISEHPLRTNANELTERFVRGDTSRSTEGSGLGLSIARGFVEHMGGILEIQTDGDMFKVIVSFPQIADR